MHVRHKANLRAIFLEKMRFIYCQIRHSIKANQNLSLKIILHFPNLRTYHNQTILLAVIDLTIDTFVGL